MQVFATFLLDVRCLPQLFFHLIFIAQNRIVRHKTQKLGGSWLASYKSAAGFDLSSPCRFGISDSPVILDAN